MWLLISQHKFKLCFVSNSSSKSNTCSVWALERRRKFPGAEETQPHPPPGDSRWPFMWFLSGIFLYSVHMIPNFTFFKKNYMARCFPGSPVVNITSNDYKIVYHVTTLHSVTVLLLEFVSVWFFSFRCIRHAQSLSAVTTKWGHIHVNSHIAMIPSPNLLDCGI